MKKMQLIKSLLLLMLGLITFACASESTENTDTDVLNNTEVEQTNSTTEVSQEKEYQQPAELVLEAANEMLITDKFYPIGWSKDGKFAYIIEPLDEAVGMYFIKIVVQDMNSDKILWKFEYDPTSQKETGSLKETWTEKYAEIKKKFNEFQIEPIAKFELGKSNFNIDAEKFNILVEKGKAENSELNGMKVYSKFAVKIKTSTLGAKQVFSCKEDYPSILDAKVYGHLKSPFENRIAVLVATERMGYEGPPNTISFDIVGAGLDTGFKK